MSHIIVTGGRRLSGEVCIQGSKNAVLPILCASLLNAGITVLTGCPRISDVSRLLEVLIDLGCIVTWNQDCLVIDAANLKKHTVGKESASKTRGSILFLGALLGRCKKATIAYPGGCSIGARPIDYHIHAMRKLGVQIIEKQEEVVCFTQEIVGTKIRLKFPSVGTTENILLASVLARGRTEIINAAMEPEITALCEFLNSAGAKISGLKTSHLVIEGVEKLHDTVFHVPPDRIVAGTYMAAAAIAGGTVYLDGVIEEELSSVIHVLRRMGCEIMIRGTKAKITRERRLISPIQITTAPFPGFPTDMQSQMMPVMSLACNDSYVVEEIFNNRLKIADELNKLGAEIRIQNENRVATIRGNRHLIGNQVEAKDLRGGAALVIAGLAAEGSTTISNVHYIERGYEDICRDLTKLSASIKYEN